MHTGVLSCVILKRRLEFGATEEMLPSYIDEQLAGLCGGSQWRSSPGGVQGSEPLPRAAQWGPYVKIWRYCFSTEGWGVEARQTAADDKLARTPPEPSNPPTPLEGAMWSDSQTGDAKPPTTHCRTLSCGLVE